ncbi:MAG: ornithine carbamoyltransferase [Candidatus Micrarchaeia archaeon]
MHFLTLKDFDGEWIESVISLAIAIKKNPARYRSALGQKTLAMLFQKTSTRTRVSFETGMTRLGGHAIYMDWRSTQFVLAELQDEAKAVSRYVDAIMVRPLRHETLLEMAKGSEVPIINGLSEKYHPCQALADVMTVKERFGALEGKKVVYLGIANNVSNSLSLACAKCGADFVLCTPERDSDSLDTELLLQAKTTGHYSQTTDVSAVRGADILYTDTWVNMEYFSDPKFAKEKARREKLLKPYQLNRRLLERAGPQACSMHDMPAHIGYEVDEYCLRGPRSLAFVQAENRMWAQMALLLRLLGAE